MRLLCLFDRYLFRLVSIVTQCLLMVAVLTAFYQVLTRFVLHAPSDWSEILTRAVLIWTVMLGVSLAFRHGAMISVEMLRERLKGRAQRVLEWLLALVCAGFLLFLAWIGGQMTHRVRFQSMPSLDISISWIYLSIPVGMTLAAIAVFARLFDREQQTPVRNDAQG